MGLPNDLVLVRHGESEGNVAIRASKIGDQSYFNIKGFRDRPGHDWRLTDFGIIQAKAAGQMLRTCFPSGFDRYYVSDFARAKETAMYLDLPDARWYLNIYLHEQLWGQMDVIPRSEYEQKFPGAHAQRNRQRFYGSYPGGESMAEVCLRCDRILETLGRECSGRQVILVCHGNTIWAFRMLIERITPNQYHRLDSRNEPQHQIHNGQIFHYTRRKPTSGDVKDHFGWYRTMRPLREATVDESWQTIVRPTFSNTELKAELEYIPQLISGG
jgi:broad specificity phosphatase PhoE